MFALKECSLEEEFARCVPLAALNVSNKMFVLNVHLTIIYNMDYALKIVFMDPTIITVIAYLVLTTQSIKLDKQ